MGLIIWALSKAQIILGLIAANDNGLILAAGITFGVLVITAIAL